LELLTDFLFDVSVVWIELAQFTFKGIDIIKLEFVLAINSTHFITSINQPLVSASSSRRKSVFCHWREQTSWAAVGRGGRRKFFLNLEFDSTGYCSQSNQHVAQWR